MGGRRLGYGRRWRSVLLSFLIISVLFFTQSLITHRVAATPPPSDSIFMTVYPNRTAEFQTSVFQSQTPFIKNINITHFFLINENGNATRETDSISQPQAYIGNGSTIQWEQGYCFYPNSYYYCRYNHLVTVNGPESFTLTWYPNSTSLPAKHQFTIPGTYTYQTSAITTDPHTPSAIGYIYVINAEENQPSNVSLDVTVMKHLTEATVSQTFSEALTAFQKTTLPPPFNDTDSISLTGSLVGGQFTGTINLQTVSGVFNPLGNLTLTYTSNSTNTSLKGNEELPLNPSLPYPFTNHTAFNKFYTSTFGNTTWVNLEKQQVNTTTNGLIQLALLNVTAPSYNDDTSAEFNVTAIFNGNLLRYLILGPYASPTMITIYNQAFALWTSAAITVTYTNASGTLVIQSTSHLVNNLDSQLESIKTEILNQTNPAYRDARWEFLNATLIHLNNFNVHEVLNSLYNQAEFSGLLVQPPTSSYGIEFDMPGVFNYIGYMYSPVNFTLIGGSDATGSAWTDIPGMVPSPNSYNVNYTDTWLNFQNFTALAPIRFGAESTHTPLSVSLSTSALHGRIPFSAQFIAAVGGGTPPYTYDWSFGDGGTSSSQDPVHTYPSAGTYTASVSVTDSLSAKVTSAPVTIRAVIMDSPSAPSYLYVIPGPGRADLFWSTPTDDGGAPISQYRIYRGTSHGGESLLSTTPGSAFTYSDSNITIGVTYYYQVSAVNTVGEGGRSSEVTVTISSSTNLPSAPRNLVAIAGNGMVTLQWAFPLNAGGSPISGFIIYRGNSSGTENMTYFASNTTYIDMGVVNGQTYYYQVLAFNGNGQGPLSSEASATPVAPLVSAPFTSGGTTFNINTNATISNFQYNAAQKGISFTVSGGAPGSMGEANITIPKTLVSSISQLTVTIDGASLPYTYKSDATNYYVFIVFHFSTHTINILFPLGSSLPPSVVLVASSLALIFLRRKSLLKTLVRRT